MKKTWIYLMAAVALTFTACEKEEEFENEHEGGEHLECEVEEEECGEYEIFAYTDAHDFEVLQYGGTDEYEIINEHEWWEEVGSEEQIHNEFFKEGATEAFTSFHWEDEQIYCDGGVGESFGINLVDAQIDPDNAVDYPASYLFFDNEAEEGDSWQSICWGVEVEKTFVGIDHIDVPAGEFCCKVIEIDLGHGTTCKQWVNEIGLIQEVFYENGQEVAEYYLIDFEEFECDDCEEEEEFEEECECEEED